MRARLRLPARHALRRLRAGARPGRRACTRSEAAGGRGASTDAFFDFDKATLKLEGAAALDEVAAQLAGTQYDTITIVGHTDRIGTVAYNQKLSERRADAMAQYLIGKGVPAEKISASGLGEKNPTAQCSGQRGARLIACLQPDRYAEVTVSGTATQVSAAAGSN